MNSTSSLLIFGGAVYTRRAMPFGRILCSLPKEL